MISLKSTSLLLIPAIAAMTMLTGCESDHVVYSDYGDNDFYYVSGVPYSHSYGTLVVRDGGYYYNRGGRYYRYERHYGGGGYYANRDRQVREVDRVHNVNTRNVTNVRNVDTRNERVVAQERGTYHGQAQRTYVQRHGQAQTQVTTRPQGTTRTVTTTQQRVDEHHKKHRDEQHD
jgi:hypothetical protein